MPSKIEWTDESWNLIAGCTKCSPGCLNCWAEKMAFRLWHMGHDVYGDVISGVWDGFTKFRWSGKIVCRENVLDKPLHWRKPRRIFICSMSDLFHPDVDWEFRHKIIKTIIHTPQHTHLMLTKRVNAMRNFFNQLYLEQHNPQPVIPNLHLGVSISNQAEADEKIPILLQIPAAIRWLSIEPMLGKIQDICHGYDRPQVPFNRKMVDGWFWEELSWVVVGGESGPKRRPCKTEWIENIVEQCKVASVPVFVKQIHQGGKVVKMPKGWPQEYPTPI